MSNFDIKNFLIEKSKENCFDKIGFVQANFLNMYKDNFYQWLAKGYNAEMQFMAKEPEKRLDVRLLQNSAKTIVIFLKNYNTRANQKQKKFKIAKYAFFDDYHIWMKKNILQIAKNLEQKVDNLEYRIFVDTAPILEKAIAVEAGLGWYGKNSLLVTKKGSFFLIGILLINIEIDADNQISADYCGNCNKCIDSCPTKAIVSPRIVDSNRCISYLTIEKKGDFQPQMNLNFQNWIFGCDICQDVCPWNSKSLFTIDKNLNVYDQIVNFSEQDWENISEADFKLIFKNSAIKRTKYSGLIRNINYVKQNSLSN